MKRDFVALYEAGEPARKYISYKVADKEMEGKELGSAELAAPTKPGHYFARYLRADYSELAVSATIVVRSALSVLLEEVKSEGMKGNAETVLEMFETVMLSLKPNDDALHKQALDRWRDLQHKKSRPPPVENEASLTSALSADAGASGSGAAVSPESQSAAALRDHAEGALGEPATPACQPVAGVVDLAPQVAPPGSSIPPVGATGELLRLRVRGSGHYTQKKGTSGADGDARLVVCGGRALVEGDAARAKAAAGLHLLVLRLSDFHVLFAQCYDTHHDSGAAERLANDIAAQALDHAETDASRILVVVTSQYAWEGYFNSPLLCDRLVRKNSNACSKAVRAMFGVAGRLCQGIAAHESRTWNLGFRFGLGFGV